MNVNTQQVTSVQHSSIEVGTGCTAMSRQASPSLPDSSEDDRYPGSFFRIPGIPSPGKTTWSLAK